MRLKCLNVVIDLLKLGQLLSVTVDIFRSGNCSIGFLVPVDLEIIFQYQTSSSSV
jgi:hypothetical protein